MLKPINSNIEKVLQTGNLAQLKEWVKSGQQFKRKRYDLTNGDNKSLLEAVKHGHFDMAKWLVEECGQKVIPTHPRLRAEIQCHSAAPFHYDPSDPVPYWMNAITVAVKNQHLDIAKWLLQHTNNNMSKSDVRELLCEVIISDDFEFFRFFHSYVKSHIDPRDFFDRVALLGTFDMIKWMIEDSGQIIDLSENNCRAVRMVLSTEKIEEDTTTTLAKWIVEQSGQIIDCRDCENWVGMFEMPFERWLDEDKEYLLSVKQQQDALGLEKWAEMVRLKRALDAKVKRRI